ncbi:MAG: murein biosynthesis integral membrane protein MurJ [Candidatus Omnitrophota bacterium]
MSRGKNTHLLKSAGIIGFATVISRVLGYLRDILMANFFGTGLYAQAFVVAFRIPNMLRDLIGEGATNAAFVPVLSQYKETEDKLSYWKLTNVLLNVLLVVLSLITFLGVLLSPMIVRLIAPGFISDPEKLNITIYLTRFMFPYVLLVGLLAYSMGILNSLKHFSVPAFASSILNLSIIICALAKKGDIRALAAGVLIGGVVQLAMQFPVLFLKGYRFDFKVGFRHPAVKKMGILLIPRVLGSCVYQISIFVSTMLASLSHIVGYGGVAALYYSNRIFQFPLAIFGIAIAQAALPTMSREALEEGYEKLKETLSFSLRVVNFIMIPASIGLIVLARPITRILFERGMFDEVSTSVTSGALAFYSIGLFSYAGIKILVSCFYSLKDTATPVKIASISLVLNIILSFVLMFYMKINGLALATSCSGIVNFLLLFFALREKIGSFDGFNILVSSSKVFLASIIMVFSLLFFSYIYVLNIFIVIMIGIVSYLLSVFLLDQREAKEFIKWVLRKK